jgi:rare lipoprotein A
MSSTRASIIVLGLSIATAMLPLDLAKADQVGHASWYALHSRTASGEQMDPGAMTAAHPSLPFGTRVLVENLSNGHSVVVRINDRGPFVAGRIIDVSKAAASTLGMLGTGTAKVRVSTAGSGRTGRGLASAVQGGLLRSARNVTQVATRQRSRSNLTVASARHSRGETRYDRGTVVALAPATNPYGGILGRAPGFMKVSDTERGRGSHRGVTRLAAND